MRRLLVIRNPIAGRGRARRLWPGIARRLSEAGFRYEEVLTSGPGEAIGLSEKASLEFDCVVACGGDGTVHEVANGLMRAGAKAALGVIPVGSGDDFAKMLGPGDPIRNILAGKTRVIDIGTIKAENQTRFFANGMDIGFGAHGARNVASVPGIFGGLAAYLGALVLTLVRYPLLRARLQLDDAPPFELTTVMTAVMNGTTFGGSFHVCPQACLDDGVLDLLVADALGRLEILGLVPKIMRGAHGRDPRLRLLRARRVRIESEAPLLVEADGEIVFEDARALEIEVIPSALRVVA